MSDLIARLREQTDGCKCDTCLLMLEAGDALESSQKESERCRDYDARLTAVMPADYKDWHENSEAEWPMIAAETLSSLRQREDDAWERVGALEAADAKKRKPSAAWTQAVNEITQIPLREINCGLWAAVRQRCDEIALIDAELARRDAVPVAWQVRRWSTITDQWMAWMQCVGGEYFANLIESDTLMKRELFATPPATPDVSNAAVPVAWVSAHDLQGMTLGHYGSVLAYGERITRRAEVPLYAAPPAAPDTLRDRCEALVKELIALSNSHHNGDSFCDGVGHGYEMAVEKLTDALGDSDGK